MIQDINLIVSGKKSCCICYREDELKYKCNQCSDTYLCQTCIMSCMETGKLKNCPICRKQDDWVQIISPISNLKYKLYLKNFKKKFLDIFKKIIYSLLFILSSFVIGTIVKEINGICHFCSNIYLSIFATITMGMFVIIVVCMFISCISICIIGCVGIGTSSN